MNASIATAEAAETAATVLAFAVSSASGAGLRRRARSSPGGEAETDGQELRELLDEEETPGRP
jgi:hypothetical protein